MGAWVIIERSNEYSLLSTPTFKPEHYNQKIKLFDRESDTKHQTAENTYKATRQAYNNLGTHYFETKMIERSSDWENNDIQFVNAQPW